MRHESVWQLPTKTPEKMIDNKKRSHMVFDDYEGKSEKHKSNKIKKK